MADRLRAGIIGSGFMGGVHAQAVRAAGAEVVAVASSTPGSAAKAASSLGAVRAAPSAADLIAAPDVDVVHVCTPNATHLELASAAIAAGKHVVCEKPLATTLADARALDDLARRSDSVTAVPFVYRHYAVAREARARIANGEAGRLHLLHGSYLQDWMAESGDSNWRADPSRGGASRAFADIGVHWCDLMEFVTGHRIVRLLSSIRTVFPRRGPADEQFDVANEDFATVLFETDLGASGSVVVSQVSLGRKNRLQFSFDGTLASYSFDQEAPDTLLVGGRHANTLIPRDAQVLAPTARGYSVLPPGHPQGYQDSFNSFIGDAYAVMGGETRDGLATFSDGLRAAAITDAVLRSADARTWVEVPS
ncbi:MAG: Gfo/Idh/MocA family protein [Streptosporangiaceae bacterium]